MAKLFKINFGLEIGFPNLVEMFEHKCRFVPVGVRAEHRDESHGMFPFGGREAGVYTTVLGRCKCGNTNHKELRGSWTLSEFGGTTVGESIDKLIEETKK